MWNGFLGGSAVQPRRWRWRAVYSDVIGDGGGNGERVGYIYDKRAVTFNGLAAEADAPRAKRGFEYLPEKSFWRAPYMAAFRSGSFDFAVLTTHVRWSKSADSRVEELGMLADWIEAHVPMDRLIEIGRRAQEAAPGW